MAKRRNINICLGKENSVQISSMLREEKDGSSVTLSGRKVELIIKKRGVNICLGQQHSVQTCTFYNCFGQYHNFGYSCPYQIPACE